MSKEKENPSQEDIENIKENIQQEYNNDPAEEFIDEGVDQVEDEQTVETQEISETEQLKADLDKEKDKFLRLFAEFENYKRRTSKERLELFKTANQEVMTAMLPVLDDFDRALNEIQKAKDKNLLKGVELIHNKFRETLKNKGLEAMEVRSGDSFDADMHEAITQVQAPSDKLKGKIVDVVERGYKLGDKIIRFPKVVTGK
ncbi:MAG TPA: nucleotide exchange factor GrpE [Gillisia sp.]|nr:nucleotide exchange factor GrpE [Gillisia sp.]